MELIKCAYEECKFKPKEMISGYCKKHQRFRIHKEGLALGKHFCRLFFRGCDSEVPEGVKTCESCLAKNKVGKTFCDHKGCRFQVEDEKYCGKHSRDKYYDEEKAKRIRYCDIARGCFEHCEKDMASCKSCLERSRVKDKAQYDERVLASEVLRNTLKLNTRVCIMCGKDFDCFMTRYNKESVKCINCNNQMQKQDDKRYDREREYKKEMLEHIETYYKQYTSGALKRSLKFELTMEHFTSLISKPCYYCNHQKEGEANGIDRMDNEKGYIIDNCLPCCEMCNRMKHVYHFDFFLEKVKQITTKTPPDNDFITMWQYYYPKETVRYNKYKYNSDIRGVPLNLTETQYNEITHKPCYLCGYSNTEGIGIDRMDNSIREYTYENCRPCCKPCNIMKATVSYQEFLDKCKEISIKASLL